MMTQLLQAGLSHSLLLVSRGHLFDHHGCVLTLLQSLLFWPWMLQGTWWETFTHRWGELSRQARIGRGGEVVIHPTTPSFTTM